MTNVKKLRFYCPRETCPFHYLEGWEHKLMLKRFACPICDMGLSSVDPRKTRYMRFKKFIEPGKKIPCPDCGDIGYGLETMMDIHRKYHCKKSTHPEAEFWDGKDKTVRGKD